MSKVKHQQCVINFTFHTIKLAKEFTDPFQVEWKRHDSNGYTEKAFCNNDDEVSFEKHFRCKVTMYVNSSNNTVRPKLIQFTINVFKGTKKKIFGKFEVDVGQFYNSPAPKTIKVKIETPHKGENIATLSFSSTANQTPLIGNGTNTDDNLMSMSEAVNLATDVRSEWDVSDIVTPDDKERIGEFFQQRHNEREKKKTGLSQFNRTVPVRGPSAKNRLKCASVCLTMQPNMGGGLNAFLSRRPEKEKEETAQEETIVEEEVEADKLSPIKELMCHVLRNQWERSPIDLETTPKSVSAIVALFMNINLFEPTSFNDDEFYEMLTTFITLIKDSNLVDEATDFEKFFVYLNILSCIQTDLRLDQDRVKIFHSFIAPFVSEHLDEYIKSVSKQFKQLAYDFINLSNDPETLAKSFLNKTNDVIKIFDKKEKMKKIIKEQIISAFNSTLIETLIENPSKIMFNNAIQWNSLLTILSNDYQTDFVLFKEVTSVIMMSSAICSSPESKFDICPNLPKEIVLKILTLQKPDDFLPIKNDVASFISYFSLEPQAKVQQIPTTYQKGFEDIFDEMPNEWIQNSFSEQTLNEFTYLNTFFA